MLMEKKGRERVPREGMSLWSLYVERQGRQEHWGWVEGGLGQRSGKGRSVEGRLRWLCKLKVTGEMRGHGNSRLWDPQPKGTMVRQHMLAGASTVGLRGMDGQGMAASGRLSPLTRSRGLLAALGFGLCFSSQALGLPKQEVFELAASLVSGTSAVGGWAGNVVKRVKQYCPPPLPSGWPCHLGLPLLWAALSLHRAGSCLPSWTCFYGLPGMAILAQGTLDQGACLTWRSVTLGLSKLFELWIPHEF